MNDFAKLIQQEMKNGMTKEELAKRFADALNAQADTSVRQKILEEMEQTLLNHVTSGHVYYSDAAVIIALITATDNPVGKKWDTDQIKRFLAFATKIIETIPKEFNLFEKLSEGAEEAGAGFNQLVNRLLETISKSECNRGNDKHGESCEIPKPKNDGDTIADFLKDLFN